MTQPIMDRNGDVLVPRDAGIGADRVTPSDARYQELRAQALDLNVPDDPEADAVIMARLENRFRSGHAA